MHKSSFSLFFAFCFLTFVGEGVGQGSGKRFVTKSLLPPFLSHSGGRATSLTNIPDLKAAQL